MESRLRAGIAVYNAGEHHAAHDAWEGHWLGLEDGTDDERFLHGLIQFTAAIYHAGRRNWSGAAGLADSAADYLTTLPATYRGVDVGAVRQHLATLAADPEVIERRPPPALTHRGRELALADLEFEAAVVAASVLAEAREAYDEATVERAVELATEEYETGTRTRFIALVMDFVADEARRDLVYRRLRDHVERRDRERADVEGLFE